MSDESLIIIDSNGSLLSHLNRKEKITLNEMGYILDKSEKKVELQQLLIIDFAIHKSKDDTTIIHRGYHDSPKRNNESLYFLYKIHENNAKSDLLTTLKRFINKVDEEKIIHHKDAISNFIKELFCWDDILENDNKRLIDFLNQSYGLDREKTTKIIKIDDGKTINATYGKKNISLNLNDDNMEVYLKINDVRTDRLIVKKENGKLNIYRGPHIELKTDVSSLLEKVKMCMDKNQSIKLAAKNLDIALLFLDKLCYKYNYNINYNFIIYKTYETNLKGNINVIIDENISGIELYPTKKDIVRMLTEIKEKVRQKDKVGAKNITESLVNMVGG